MQKWLKGPVEYNLEEALNVWQMEKIDHEKVECCLQVLEQRTIPKAKAPVTIDDRNKSFARDGVHYTYGTTLQTVDFD